MTKTLLQALKQRAINAETNKKDDLVSVIMHEMEQINIYTDGSKTKQGAGAGYVVMKGKDTLLHAESINLTGNASIFQAELLAIQAAAVHMLTREDTYNQYVKIFSDSQAALQALKAKHGKAQTVKDTHDALNDLELQSKQVRLTWIKAHIGLDGNELADEYAKLGTVDLTTQINTHTTYKEIRAATREYVYHKWREKWKALKKCRMTKLFYDGPDRRVGKVVARLSRNDMTLFIHAITGHNNLNYMNSIIIPDYTPLCRFCEEEDETFDHLYTDCPVFWRERREIKGAETGLQGWTVTSVLRMAKLDDILQALKTNITEDIVKQRR